MGEGNAAVQAVGRNFFRITIVGYLLSAALMLPAVILGIQGSYFEFEMDRCSCVVPGMSSATSSATGSPNLDDDCVIGDDYVKADIGWQKFTYDAMVHTVGCPVAVALFEADSDALAERLDDPQSFGAFSSVYPIDGVFQKTDNPTQADEDNGGSAAGEGVVAMQVVCAFLAIFTYTILKASYRSNGSHCSVGLGLVTRINFLMGMGLAAALASFWWLIEGRFGDEDKALTQAFVNTFFNECWQETTSQSKCDIRPWDFTGPGLALTLSIIQVSLFILVTLYMFWKAPTVEGVLDGSMDPTGVALKPRVVEVEMVVGKALATDGDPDYDSENPLYNGSSTMIRPYPLPKSAKAAQGIPDADVETYDDDAERHYDDDSSTALPLPPQGDLGIIVEGSEEDSGGRYSGHYNTGDYNELGAPSR